MLRYLLIAALVAMTATAQAYTPPTVNKIETCVLAGDAADRAIWHRHNIDDLADGLQRAAKLQTSLEGSDAEKFAGLLSGLMVELISEAYRMPRIYDNDRASEAAKAFRNDVMQRCINAK